MDKKTDTDDQKLKLREELISKFIAFWIDENDFLDVMFDQLKIIIDENDDYHIFSIDEILFEALGISYKEGGAFISNYLYSGLIKDWIKLFQEIHIHLEDELSPNNSSLGSYLIESKTYIEDAIYGLIKSLSGGKIDSIVQEKIISILQNFPWKINDFPIFYLYLVICHGLIGSEKSLAFLRAIINESDIFSNVYYDDGYGEYVKDQFRDARILAIKALIKISDNNELNYLIERLKKDCSFKVKQVLYFEIQKFDLPNILVEELKDTKRYDDIIYPTDIDKKFLLSNFDEVYNRYLQ